MNKRIWCVVVALMFTPAAGAAQDIDADTLQQWRTELAVSTDTFGQVMLGLMYEDGLGIPQDHAETVRWYRMAAEQGDATAQSLLGFMYRSGEGVPQDYVSAHMWFNLAVANGADAGGSRDHIESLMTPADISEAQRRARVCFNSNYRDCD